MNRNLLILSSAVFLATSFNAFADDGVFDIVPVSEPEVVQLSGGEIEPDHILNIPLEKLQADIHYDVTCTIHNNNQKYKRFIPIKIYFGNKNVKSDKILLNEKVVNMGSGMASDLSTTTQDNSYQNVDLYYNEKNIEEGYSYLTFINLDKEISVRVENCLATPRV